MLIAILVLQVVIIGLLLVQHRRINALSRVVIALGQSEVGARLLGSVKGTGMEQLRKRLAEARAKAEART